MSRKYTVKTIVDGVEVEGEVIRSRFDFTVIMTKPFKGLTGGSHIPMILRLHEVDGRPYVFDGAYGDRRILEILRELYEDEKGQF